MERNEMVVLGEAATVFHRTGEKRGTRGPGV